MTDSTPEFSVVIPICNEQENIPELCTRLTGVMEIALCSRESARTTDTKSSSLTTAAGTPHGSV